MLCNARYISSLVLFAIFFFPKVTLLSNYATCTTHSCGFSDFRGRQIVGNFLSLSPPQPECKCVSDIVQENDQSFIWCADFFRRLTCCCNTRKFLDSNSIKMKQPDVKETSACVVLISALQICFSTLVRIQNVFQSHYSFVYS